MRVDDDRNPIILINPGDAVLERHTHWGSLSHAGMRLQLSMTNEALEIVMGWRRITQMTSNQRRP